MAGRNAGIPPEKRIEFRIGINLGDVIAEGEDIFGDGVNVAARLEALAEPGGICVSRVVRDQVRDKLDFAFDEMGEQQVKNIARPVRVYRLREGAAPIEGALPVAPQALPLPYKPSIAVLPFANMSGDPEQEFFADGITEDIITLLAGWRAFPVIARTSTFTYKSRTVDIRRVGEELGARYVVEGSVRKSEGRVRVTAQLIEADTGHQIMAQRCDRDLKDLLDLQDEVVTAIAGAIEPELLKFERNRIAQRPEHDQDAYNLYQRGAWHHYRSTKADNVEAQRLFRAALAINRDYPQAIAALAVALCSASYNGWAANAECTYMEAYDLALRAVALDVLYPTAHLALGLVCMWTRRFDRGMVEFQEAINLNPSYAAAYALLGQMHLYRGQPEEAITLAEKGIRLNPRDPRQFMWFPAAGAHYQLGHYEQAIDIGRRASALNPNWPAGCYVVAGLGQLGRIEEAQTALAELKAHNPSLADVETIMRRFYRGREGVDHLLDGLRKAGMPEE
jgi:adenylate cyclase